MSESDDKQCDRFDSWKEIARYIHRDARTAMRWEKERGLPVRRAPGGKRGAVFAYREELDAWLRNLTDSDREITPAWPDAASGTSIAKRRAKIYYILATSIAVLVVTSLVFSLRRRGIPERINVAGASLSALDSRGRVVWEYHFAEPVRAFSSEEEKWRVRLMDLDGDGRRELLFAASFADPRESHPTEELYCFSNSGKVLWRYKPTLDVKFNTRDLNGPWVFGYMLVASGGRSPSVWLVVNHGIFWPSFIVKIAPNGRTELRFVQSGEIFALHEVQTKSGNYLVAGGINNEYSAASIAVLEESGSPAVSPQSHGVRFECIEGCPSGWPFRYILLPRSEFNVASTWPYNYVSKIHSRSGGFIAETNESSERQAFYGFSNGFDPEDAAFGGGYADMHRRLESEGRIKHRLEECGEQKSPVRIRVWNKTSDWRDVLVPWVR